MLCHFVQMWVYTGVFGQNFPRSGSDVIIILAAAVYYTELLHFQGCVSIAVQHIYTRQDEICQVNRQYIY